MEVTQSKEAEFEADLVEDNDQRRLNRGPLFSCHDAIQTLRSSDKKYQKSVKQGDKDALFVDVWYERGGGRMA
jgi:hypothetical protein